MITLQLGPKFKLLMLVVTVLHLGLYFTQMQTMHYDTADSIEYKNAAENLAVYGKLYCGDLSNVEDKDSDLISKRPIAYPVFLILTYVPIGGVWLILLLQNLISIFTYFLLFNLIQRWVSNPNLLFTIILLALILLIPSPIIYANMVMSECLLTATVFTLFYLLMSGEYKHRRLLIICLVTITAFIKPVMFPLVFISPIFLFYLYPKGSIILKLLPCTTVLAYIIFIHSLSGVYTFSSISGYNLAHYNAYQLLNRVQNDTLPANSEKWLDNVILENNKLNYPDYVKFRGKSAIDILMQFPLQYSIFHLKGALLMLIDPGNFEYKILMYGNVYRAGYLDKGLAAVKNFSQINLTYLLLSGLGKVVILIGTLLYMYNRKVPRQVKLGILGYILYMVSITGPIGANRFGLPFVFIMVYCTAISTLSLLGIKYFSTKLIE
ncbi:MAG: hypothetical protein SGJ04_07730 [Bacteroidota bacterium]|nr:hypothetical protein [Bacteroidota bacterium]